MQFLDKLDNKIVVICGATSSGKSSFGLELASKINGVIINGDALQVYKDIPILTGQPTRADYQKIKHMLYGVIDCGNYFSVYAWIQMALSAIKICAKYQQTPIIIGGSGLYIKSLVDGIAYVPHISSHTLDKIASLSQNHTSEELHAMLSSVDSELAEKLKKPDLKRITRGLAVFFETGIPLSAWQMKQTTFLPRKDFFIINISISRDVLYQRCDERLVSMFNTGAVKEVAELLQKKPTISYPRALGLYEIASYLKGETSLESALQKAQQLTRNYAKRQCTWFKHQMHYDYKIENTLAIDTIAVPGTTYSG